jgi:hypothetical protein
MPKSQRHRSRSRSMKRRSRSRKRRSRSMKRRSRSMKRRSRELRGGMNDNERAMDISPERSVGRQSQSNGTIVNPVMKQFERHLGSPVNNQYYGIDSNIRERIGLQGQYLRYLYALDNQISLIPLQKAEITELFAHILTSATNIGQVNNAISILGSTVQTYKDKNDDMNNTISNQIDRLDYNNKDDRELFETEYTKKINIMKNYVMYLKIIQQEVNFYFNYIDRHFIAGSDNEFIIFRNAFGMLSSSLKDLLKT